MILVVGGLILGLVAPSASAETLDRWGGPSNGSTGSVGGYRSTTPVVAAPLDAAEVTALTGAVNEEYDALNTDQVAIAQFGNLYPFSQIARTEQQHVNALARLFTRYGLEVPANPGLASTPTWGVAADAFQTGVAAEIADAALYDELKPKVDNADTRSVRVFANLQAASLNNHLPAFGACN